MKILTVPSGLLKANMHIVYDESHNAIVIDPIDHTTLVHALLTTSLSLKAIFLTHAHFDHATDLVRIQNHFLVPSFVHQSGQESLNDPRKNVSALIGSELFLGKCSNTLSDGDILSFGELTVFVHHTPGHSKDSVCYEIGDALFTGDTLFRGGIGRCDLYGANVNDMRTSLKKLVNLSKDYNVYPGHGPSTTLEREKRLNPYLAL